MIILDDSKKYLGIIEESGVLSDFDPELLDVLSMSVSNLRDAGCYIQECAPYMLGPETTYEQIFDDQDIPMAKMYLNFAAKRFVDPGNTAFMNAIDAKMDEILWRLKRYETTE